jgi:hypothetical protein
VDPETLRTLWIRAWRVLLAPDDGGGSGGGAGGTGDGAPAGSGDPPAGGTGDGAGGDGDAGLRAELAKVREEAARSRRELAKLKAAGESEQERRERELEEAKASAASATAAVRTMRLENAVLRRASHHGIVDPDVAARLVELTADAWDGDTVKVPALDAALKALVKDKPYLVRAGGAAAGDGGGSNRENGAPAGAVDMNARIREMAGRGTLRA